MKLITKQKWIKTIAWLRRNVPADSPVCIKSIKIKEHGYTKPEIGYYQIKINRRKSFDLRIDTLLHEWAHCMTWMGTEADIEDHGAEWGIAYAKLYRTFLEWNYGREGNMDD